MLESLRERWGTLTSEQKLSVSILIVCGALTVGMSVNQLRDGVYDPFLVDKNTILATKELVGLSPAEEDAMQRRTDTDGDGLSDYDETNVFRTNANLRDTCGDGVSDNVRVLTGKNLNCDGQQANQAAFIDLSQVLQSSSTVLGTSGLDLTVPKPVGLDTAGLLQAAGGTDAADAAQSLPRDPNTIRAALQGRVDATKLEQLTDDELLNMYDRAMAQLNEESSSTKP